MSLFPQYKSGNYSTEQHLSEEARISKRLKLRFWAAISVLFTLVSFFLFFFRINKLNLTWIWWMYIWSVFQANFLKIHYAAWIPGGSAGWSSGCTHRLTWEDIHNTASTFTCIATAFRGEQWYIFSKFFHIISWFVMQLQLYHVTLYACICDTCNTYVFNIVVLIGGKFVQLCRSQRYWSWSRKN